MGWFAGWSGSAGTSRVLFRGVDGDTKALRGAMLLALIDGADAIDIPRGQWIHALPMRVEALQRPGARISWHELVDALEALEQAGVTADDFARMGEAIMASPHMLVRNFVGFITRPEHMLYIGLRWMGPLLFPVLRYHLDYRGSEMTLRLDVPDGLRGCAPYFHICRGTLPIIPTLIGQPRARMSSEVLANGATYRITVMRSSTGVGRLRTLARALVSAPRLLEALAEQEREVRRSFEAVGRSQDDFRRVLDALPDAVIVYFSDRVAYVNAQLPRLLGYADLADLGSPVWSRLLWPESLATDMARLVEPGRSTSDFLFVRKDGTSATVELSPAQEVLFEGVPARLLIARDVTARRAIENEMAIADRLSSLGMLSAGLAHEINNPLTLILTNLQLASRACDEPRREDVASYVKAAIEGAERVKEITKNLHVFAQPDREVAALIDVAKVVQSTVVLATGQVRARATLDTSIEPTPAVMGNEGKLGQVLLNLLINALQALPSDRTPGENKITVRLRTDNHRVMVDVEDNGVGISDEVRGRIFEPFFSTKQATSGTGLGLAVAHGIVAAMSGTIKFESHVGRGTVFTVSLPAAVEIPVAHPGMPVATDVRERPCGRSHGRVLVVDDEPALRDIIEELLVDKDHEVVTAASGEQAIEVLRADSHFDAIVCDLMMSNGTGLDVYRYLESDNPELAPRMLFMTGGVYRDDVREFLSRIGNRCLQKPFSLDDVCDEVAAAVAESQSGA